MQHSEFQVIWNYDVVFFFFCLKGFTWIVFLFEWYSYKIYLFVAKMNLVTLLYQTLCTLIVWCVCVCVGEWVKEVGFGSFYSSPPTPPLLHWMMLGQVFLFWCVSYLSMLLLLSSLSPICALTVGLLLFSARFVSSYWTVGYFGSWPVKGTWRCEWLLS